MLPPEGQRIIDFATQGNPWEALGVSKNATPDEISTAHLKLRHRFREYPEVQVALSQAKAALHTEPKAHAPFRVRAALNWSKFISVVASILISWPVRLLAMVGTALVLWHMHSIVMTIIVMAVLLPFVLSLYKGNFTPWYYITSVLILLIGGFSASIYLALNKLTHFWPWASIILALSTGIGLFLFFGGSLIAHVTDRLRRPNLWKCIGVFCALFMVTFGMANLLFAEKPVTEITSSALSYIKSNTWLFIILWWALAASLISFFAGIYTGAVFSRSEWVWEWDKASESRFSFGFMATVLSMRTVLESIFYLPFIRAYISAAMNVVIDVSELLTKHLQEFLLYTGAISVLTLPVYLIIISITKGITRKAHWSLVARMAVLIISYWVSMYLIKWAVPALGLQIPIEGQFVVFQDAIFNIK